MKKQTIRHEDLMIWDSGFGFDIVEFISKSQAFEGLQSTVKKITDSCILSLVGENVMVPNYQLSEYTDILLNQMRNKYPHHKNKGLPKQIQFT